VFCNVRSFLEPDVDAIVLRSTKALLAACVCSLVGAAPAVASTYTLDGKPTTREVGVAAGGGCAAIASPDDVIACFSSDGARDAALSASLKAGELPAGFAAKPTADQAQALLARASASASRGPKAHAADNPCTGGPYTHVYTNPNSTGTHGYFSGTGGSWQNHSGDFNNLISSYAAATDPSYVPYWHDLVNGGGAYYDLAYCGRVVADLANGSWDDRFSSFKAG
jgi:hypothetical protein